MEINEPGLDVDRERRAVSDRSFDGVPVQDPFRVVRVTEGGESVVVLRRHGCAGQADELGVRQGLAHVETQSAFLGSVRLIHHHDDVPPIVEEAGFGELEDGCHDDAAERR